MSVADSAIPHSCWLQPARAAALFAVDPAGLGGIVLRSRPGPLRDQWLTQLRALLPVDSPWRRLPANTGDDRLLGGLDLSATLRSGRPVAERGLLAECHEGVLLLAMAERLDAGATARLSAVLDNGVNVLERGGISQRIPARIGMIALDEGIGEDEMVPEALRDRFAIHLELDAIDLRESSAPFAQRAAIEAARTRLSAVRIAERHIEVLCEMAEQFGITSLRAVTLAIRTARAAAALARHPLVSDEAVTLAAQLVFSSRATRIPDQQPAPTPEDEPHNGDNQLGSGNINQHSPDNKQNTDPQALNDRVLEAVQAAIPPQLMQQLRYQHSGRASARASARSAARRRPARRGRRVGVRPGNLTEGSRLNLIETLRAAAPWQALRHAQRPAGAAHASAIRLRREDFRINRYQQRSAMTTVFVVDASGSSALHRLAEAKGAVELLLAESYRRRDRVALVTFRGQLAELLLSPTRSLVRAKRSLAALPGGGGTPLAAGLQLALDTAQAIRRKDETPVIVLLTDGRANVSLEGKGDRDQARTDSLEVARRLRIEGITTLLVDTSPRPNQAARELADCLAAHYLALPHADAHRLSGAAQQVMAGQAHGKMKE